MGSVDGSLRASAAGDPERDRPPAESRRFDPASAHVAQHYAAIIESSEDAILSKDLSGVILSWNDAAERLFGYTAAEAIGRPVTLIIPADRLNEEPSILEKIRHGERIRHFETVRQRKDGSLIDISLTISPIKDAEGRIVGASKIARDITELKKAREGQHLLLREMSHRVKNLFALASSIVSLSARSAKSVQDLGESARERLSALARAHSLTFAHGMDERTAKPATLLALIQAIVVPFDGQVGDRDSRIIVSGVDMPVVGSAVTSLALLLHEFATNAAKYGALTTDKGAIEIVTSEHGDRLQIDWIERGGPAVVEPKGVEGFGGVLSRIAVTSQLGGEIVRTWKPEGLEIRVSVPRSRLAS